MIVGFAQHALSGNCMALWALPVDGQRRSRNCDKHDSDLLFHAVRSPPCPNLYVEILRSCWIRSLLCLM